MSKYSVIFIFLAILVSCDNASIRKGKELASIHCVSCHQLPSPDELDKKTWEIILPKMAARMGVLTDGSEWQHMRLLQQVDLLPSRPLMDTVSWKQIRDYYLSESPESLNSPPTKLEDGTPTLFSVKPFPAPVPIPDVSLVEADPSSSLLFYGGAEKKGIIVYDMSNRTVGDYPLDGAPSDVISGTDETLVLTMGNIHPNNARLGKVFKLANDSATLVIDELTRPVHISRSDLNKDGKEDLVVSGFGYLIGELAWYDNQPEGFIRNALLDVPGAIRTEIADMNNDGNPDILALMAQGDEGFFYFSGDGKGSFRMAKIISFPPSFGSSYFELADMNGDGMKDIIYVNGDNGDYPAPVLKPYHGIRIFLREATEGRPSFKESYFFHMNGPFKAMAEDYDMDGDMDIACISYFPDYARTPHEGIVFLERISGELEFRSFGFRESLQGKWLTADRGDIDGDGDIDIILGNGPIMSLNVPDTIRQSWESAPVTLMLMENKTF